MAWLKIDDGFAEHQKISGLSDRAFRVHVAALCYCARNLTDGHLDQKAVNVVCAIVGTRSKAVLKELVSSALWHTEGDTFRINDFTEYNPTSEQVKAERTKAAERMRRLRSGRSSAERADEQTAHVRGPRPVPSPSTTEAAAVGTTPPAPDPGPDAAAAFDDQDKHLAAHADSVELEQLLDDLAIPSSLRERARQDPARALAVARYTIEQHGNGGYFRTVYESGDTPVLAAESRVRARVPSLRFAVAVRALVAGGADRERVAGWLRDQTDDEAAIEAHLELVGAVDD